MVTPNISNALRQYQQIDAQSAVAFASPHQLIQMLMDGALESLSKAKGHIQRGEVAARGEQLSRAIGIIGGLKDGLNLEAGGEIAANLDALYDYLQRRLLEANVKNDGEMVDEVTARLNELKIAWDAIGPPAATAPPEGEIGEINSRA
ncbi:MAG: flagella export chaperone FliS [Candidatus Competibacteraceae bacterium]|nr:MAG: flagella export chaperone FliS [Candidatus Competibacteraceae bacterium]